MRVKASAFAALLFLAAATDAFAQTPKPKDPANAPKMTADKPPELVLEIDSPTSGAVIGDSTGTAFVAGRAMALFGEYQTFDIMFVIDTSDSTAAPSGSDVDGDGTIGERRGEKFLSILGRVLPLPNSDQGDSILAAEVAGMRALLNQLDPRTTRVGLIAFSGDNDALTPDAETIVPLTTDFEKVESGLNAVFRQGPHGLTNMVSAVSLATIELLGTQSAYSTRREGAKRVIMFLTDGQPTLPLENSQLQNAKMAIQQAVRAAKLDVRIDTFAIGEDALSEPVVVVEMARVSQGVFTPVRDPKDVRAIFEDVNFSDIETLEVKNKTTGTMASQLISNADGSFSALVDMKEGENTIEAFARSTDGTEGRREVVVKFLPGATTQELAPRMISQRNRLLENRLLDLQRRRVEIQAEANEDVRRELQVEIEKEREKAKAASEKMRRELDLNVEKDAKPPAPPTSEPPPTAEP
jgi:hypothetical protein